jgi:xanthine dehydrogenase YagT iron-sulfur-binding subunit
LAEIKIMEGSVSPDLSRQEFLEAGMAAAAATSMPPISSGSETMTRAAAQIAFTLNGQQTQIEVEPRVSLLDLLRERLSLTGTKKGCNEGACGTCTVLIDGKRMNACLVLAVQCEGRDVVTVEGIAGPGGELTPVQRAFIEHDAFQCGYCTPGQIVSATACIREGHATDEATVREWMSGNLCRCSAYPQITVAVLDAAQKMRRG